MGGRDKPGHDVQSNRTDIRDKYASAVKIRRAEDRSSPAQGDRRYSECPYALLLFDADPAVAFRPAVAAGSARFGEPRENSGAR